MSIKNECLSLPLTPTHVSILRVGAIPFDKNTKKGSERGKKRLTRDVCYYLHHLYTRTCRREIKGHQICNNLPINFHCKTTKTFEINHEVS